MKGTSNERRLLGRSLEIETVKTIAMFCGFGAFAATFLFSEPTFAQKLVDPNVVAPEYREAAEKRRAEQIRQHECAHKADEAKVLPRDRLSHIVRCLADDGQAPAPAVVHQ